MNKNRNDARPSEPLAGVSLSPVMSRLNHEARLETARELLGQCVDLCQSRVTSRPIDKQTEYTCLLCGDKDSKPELRHRHGCLFARIKDFLRTL